MKYENKIRNFNIFILFVDFFRLYEFIVDVVLPSALKAWDEDKEGHVSKETENGAR